MWPFKRKELKNLGRYRYFRELLEGREAVRMRTYPGWLRFHMVGDMLVTEHYLNLGGRIYHIGWVQQFPDGSFI